MSGNAKPAAADERAFRHLVEPHRAKLHAHCYRMLGSRHDADDALQEALLRAWRGMDRFEGRSAPSTWLYRIATNTCLDAISTRTRREPASTDSQLAIEDRRAGPEARYEQREAAELRFIAALQHLPARQRAVLILRDVLGYSARETAQALGTTPASVNSALQRARKTIRERPPEQSQHTTMRSPRDHRLRHTVERFIDAFERGAIGPLAAG
jgi:RNA polymerase sigma-70 factor, ECF subfamily